MRASVVSARAADATVAGALAGTTAGGVNARTDSQIPMPTIANPPPAAPKGCRRVDVASAFTAAERRA
jgi:hypothetical protein